jgi:hypothetical protein
MGQGGEMTQTMYAHMNKWTTTTTKKKTTEINMEKWLGSSEEVR